MKKIVLIMLAAGNSKRFGSNKLLHPICGIPMYRRMLNELARVRDHYKGRVDCTITVVTQYKEMEETVLELDGEVLYNLHPEQGISSSIKIGLEKNQEADACLFSVADQPWLKHDTIAELIELYLSTDRGLACLTHSGQLGNPCIFSKKYYPQLMALTGDVGGKGIIAANRDDTVVLTVCEAREMKDVDYTAETGEL